MATRKSGLTDVDVRKAAPRDKPYNLYDTNGLYLTVSAAGAKWWRFKYRFASTEKRIGFGAYPEVSLSEARHERDKARLLVRQRIDPGAAKRAAVAQEKVAATNTFEAVAREWLEVKKNGWVATQQAKELRRLEIHAFPWIGKLPIKEIGPSDIRPLLDRLVKKGTVDMAHRLRQQLSAIFVYAGRDERVDRDPAASLRGILPEHTQRNYASMSDPQAVGALLRAIDGYGGLFATTCALRLAPLVFVRPGELRGAEWAEIDLDKAEWRIPASRRKLRRRLKEDTKTPPFIVPLSKQAITILRELEPLTGGGRFVFPGVRDTKRPLSEVTVLAALRRMGFDRETMTGHGFRHMASTMLHEMGWHPDAIERQLSHKAIGIRGVYNKAEHMKERQDMMQSWADYLDGLRRGESPILKRTKR